MAKTKSLYVDVDPNFPSVATLPVTFAVQSNVSTPEAVSNIEEVPFVALSYANTMPGLYGDIAPVFPSVVPTKYTLPLLLIHAPCLPSYASVFPLVNNSL